MKQSAPTLPPRARRGRLLLAAIAVCVAAAAPLGAARAQGVRMGINDTNLYTLDTAAAHDTLDQMAHAGVRLLRVSAREKDGNLPGLVRYANDRGIQVMIVMPLGAADLYGPDVQERAAEGPYRAIRPLSALDIGRFRQFWAAHREAMRAAGAKVFAYEIGNEINAPDFNGDYPVSSETLVPLRDCAGDQYCPAVRAGMAKFVQALRVVRESGMLDGALLMGPALSDTNQQWLRHAGGSTTPIGETFAYLASIGAGNYLDAYSFHHYLRPNSPQASFDGIDRALHQCVQNGGKPCWLTEWGVRTKSADCDSDTDQQQLIAEASADLRREPPSELGGAVYFDWDSKPALSLVRCGRLSTAAPFAG